MSDTEGTTTAATAATPVTTEKHLSREESTCSIDGCKRPYRAKNYCNVHYKAWRRGEVKGHPGRYKICSKEACNKARVTGAFCAEHAAKTEAAA